jgi:2-polyprenyl-3-methyl-5-hydroxy-6-metoxy-1,4-benzoquinol methylase
MSDKPGKPGGHGQADSGGPNKGGPGPHKGPRRGKQIHRGRAATRGPGRQEPRPGGWDHVAGWYEGLVGGNRSDFHENVVLPGALRLIEPRPGLRVLDIACGEGSLCRRLAQLGAACMGVDASGQLVQAAMKLAARMPAENRPRFAVGDARHLGAVGELAKARESFDAASCVLALMNMDPFEPVLHGAAAMLKPGGLFVAVVLHPAFRSPGQTSWGWDAAAKAHAATPAVRQYRRVDAYLSIASREIVMNPAQAAEGKPAVTTVTWHRPIEVYVHAFASAGLLIDAIEEWPSHRVSQPGPRAAEEDRARREIPMFLALRARKVASSQ